MKTEYYGPLFAILSPFFSSVATIFKTGAAKNLTPLVVIVVGGIIGSIILFFISKLFREKFNFQKLKANRKDLILVFLLRSLLGELFLTFGLSQTSAIKAIFFTKIEPYFVLILAWIFLKEKVLPKHLILLLIHLIGAIILSTGGNINIVGKAQIGDLFIIIAMVLFASSYNYGKRLAQNVSSIYSNALTMGMASLILLPFLLFFSAPTKFDFQPQGWVYLLIYVVLFNVLGLTFWYASLKTVKGWIVSSLRYIGPVIGAPVAYFLLGETLSLTQLFGAAIIIVTSYLIVRGHLRHK